ncbi:MAG: FAD-dependent thymidylate synthase [Theionarchaea archaeon]|nr:FAD-dependent thymidylate synthase [Theionarchaea archaeon]MBU7037271.1 FAD-dependent thymidylate synthase [Theionarchaea archaeon]
MNVELVAHTPDPDRLCAQAALISKWPNPWSEFRTFWNDKTDLAHLTDALEKGHVSVIEHASFTFSLEGISRACSHQLVRHRLASYTQQSQRYVTLESSSFVAPPSIRAHPDAAERFSTSMHENFRFYRNLLDMGISEEDARFILPNATRTNILVTMNARELLHFFALRCCERTQWELRDVAWKMLSLAKGKAPLIFSKGGPSCVQSGYCPEKDLTCGKTKEMKEKAAAL